MPGRTRNPLYSVFLILAFAGLLVSRVAASSQGKPPAEPSPFHPDFPLLDRSGRNVLASGAPVSTTATCGQCHDTEFIANHSFHSTSGFDALGSGESSLAHEWDLSIGIYGRWDPLTYRYLTPAGNLKFDLGLAGWIQTVGLRHVGGGPAQFTPEGIELTEIAENAQRLETRVLEPETGETRAWDWKASGTIELNCFLCHVEKPNNDARSQAILSGEFAWANTWTLLAEGRLEQVDGEPVWDPNAFDSDGNVLQSALGVQDPTNENCGICHGLTDQEVERPLSFSSCLGAGRRTATTGQVFSPQRISQSGLNLADKENLARAWDVHAERLVDCSDCHFSLNNPIQSSESQLDRPQHLQFDPRRLEIGEYLYQPIHDLARAAGYGITNEVGDSAVGIDNCESCHDLQGTHIWLPFREKHMSGLACESCHVPVLYAGGLQFVDWTVYRDGPRTSCRVIEPASGDDPSLMTGYEPILLPQAKGSGKIELAPYNLISTWYWVHGDPPLPVRQIDLKAAWSDEVGSMEELAAAFDQNGDGILAKDELAVVNQRQERLLASRLESLGLKNPRIVGEVTPFPIHHSVIGGDWAIRDCASCHSRDSRLTQSFVLARYVPGSELPRLVTDGEVVFAGDLQLTEGGELLLTPDPSKSGLYILGRDSVPWVDMTGVGAFLGVLLGISAHSGLRLLRSSSSPKDRNRVRVYMYGFYERFWHWLQTIVISGLLFTGLIIHKPDLLGFLSFRHLVLVHNILAAILVVNAGLALFYHLASGEIRQFLPRPAGFFDQAIAQARYYLFGIFQGEPHPFAKTPVSKLNPLQQVTYLGILNVLLPLQILTGILMWGAQRWPAVADQWGGLAFLGPLHSLVAWLFASFILAHVYLTTTAGPRPLSSIQAMMLGWEEVEDSNNTERE